MCRGGKPGRRHGEKAGRARRGRPKNAPARWDLWFTLGLEALRRHQQRHPHELIDFGRLARLLEIAMDFGRLASGVAPGAPDPEPGNYAAAWADLQRPYGHLCGSPPLGPESPPAPAAQESNPAPGSGPVPSVSAVSAVSPGSIHPANDELRPPPLEYHRRDAWSRWARHVRSLKR
jgi:hypothetical protein